MKGIKRHNTTYFIVIPAKAGISIFKQGDSLFRGNDSNDGF
jgi:hypothetical protein